jgi:hypothetical protein
VDSVAILDAVDVPDDSPAKVKHQTDKYVRIQLAETQAMTDSDVYLWNKSGRADKMDTRTNEYPWGQPLQPFDSMTSLTSAVDRGVSENRVYVGQIPLAGIKNANGKWYACNDTLVKEVPLDSIVSNLPYCLFYRKVVHSGH